MEGKINARRQQSGGAISEILNPTRGIRDEILRRGGKPKNHVRENYLRLKALEKANQARKEEAARPAPKPFKLKQFETAKSKVDDRLDERIVRLESAESEEAKKKNYIRKNAELVKEVGKKAEIQEPMTNTSPNSRKTRMGELPKYLIDRKHAQAVAESERLRKIEAAKIPNGYFQVPESERMECLRFLKESQGMLLKDLAMLPVAVSSSYVAKKKRQDLDTKLAEVEKAIEVFSKKQVYLNEKEWKQRVAKTNEEEQQEVKQNGVLAKLKSGGGRLDRVPSMEVLSRPKPSSDRTTIFRIDESSRKRQSSNTNTNTRQRTASSTSTSSASSYPRPTSTAGVKSRHVIYEYNSPYLSSHGKPMTSTPISKLQRTVETVPIIRARIGAEVKTSRFGFEDEEEFLSVARAC